MANIIIVYHAWCLDGFGSCYAAWKKYKNNALYIPGIQRDKLSIDVKNKEVYILDFSYPKTEIQRIRSEAKKFLLLDHHESAEKALADEEGCVFDMNKSGAVLAWEYFHPNTEIPKLILYIQDRDLWKFNLPESRAHSQALYGLPMNFEIWDSLDCDSLIEYGRELLKYKVFVVSKICSIARKGTWKVKEKEYSVRAVEASQDKSEVGEELGKDCDFGVVYNYRNGVLEVSLRSREVNVATLAEYYGGGGHQHASGFTSSGIRIEEFIKFDT